ncbi:MAG: RNA-binding protein [Ruminococcaceae bacterium]|nr:RNA-binding protein [Oscillospiraceae bacterium]
MGGINKDRFLYALDSRHSVMFAHIFDMAVRADRYGAAVFGDFLSENSISELLARKDCLPSEPVLFGGFDGAERKMVAFIPEYEDPVFPINALKITSPMLHSLTHRDFLGSVLGLGIKREKCGDIIIKDKAAYIIFSEEICSFAANSLTKVGRVGVKTEEISLSEIELPERSFKTVSGTVSSLRLDSVITLFYGKGRGKAGEIISGGLVFVNGICALKNDMRLKDGDVISLRGKGKATLSVGGTSKKDRIFITLNIWS